jgi:hypothetical protein
MAPSAASSSCSRRRRRASCVASALLLGSLLIEAFCPVCQPHVSLQRRYSFALSAEPKASTSDELLRQAKLAEWRELMASGKLSSVSKVLIEDDRQREEAQLMDEMFREQNPETRRQKRRSRHAADDEQSAFDNDEDDDEDFNATMLNDAAAAAVATKAPVVADWRGVFPVAKRRAVPLARAASPRAAVPPPPSTPLEWERGVSRLETIERDAPTLLRLAESTTGAVLEAVGGDAALCEALRALCRLGRPDLALKVQAVRSSELATSSAAAAAAVARATAGVHVQQEAAGFDASINVAVAVARNGLHSRAQQLYSELLATAEGASPAAVLRVNTALLPALAGMYSAAIIEAVKPAATASTSATAAAAGKLTAAAAAVQAIAEAPLSEEQAVASFDALLATATAALQAQPRLVTVAALNAVLRHLGRANLLQQVFQLVQCMAAAVPAGTDVETYEFLANAVVKEVALEAVADSMKTLPQQGELTNWQYSSSLCVHVELHAIARSCVCNTVLVCQC